MKVHLITIGLLGLTSFLPGVHSKHVQYMSEKVKEQMDVPQVYDDGDVTMKKRMLRRHGKTGKLRKSKKGPRRSKSSKKSSSSPTLSTHSPSEMNRHTGGLFGSTSRTWQFLYFWYDGPAPNNPSDPTDKFDASCSIANVQYENIPPYTDRIQTSCEAMYTGSGSSLRHYYRIGIGVIDQAFDPRHAHYFKSKDAWSAFDEIQIQNAWRTPNLEKSFLAGLPDLPYQLWFALSADITLGSIKIYDFRIGKGSTDAALLLHNWWIGGSNCHHEKYNYSDWTETYEVNLLCSNKTIRFTKSPNDSPDHTRRNVIQIQLGPYN